MPGLQVQGNHGRLLHTAHDLDQAIRKLAIQIVDYTEPSSFGNNLFFGLEGTGLAPVCLGAQDSASESKGAKETDTKQRQKGMAAHRGSLGSNEELVLFIKRGLQASKSL